MTIDPKQVFMTAEVYRASSVLLAKLIGSGMPHFMIPMVTCSAFSLELHLKCLILLDGGAPKREHDLEKLLSLLTPESQRTIRACYDVQQPKVQAMYAAVPGVPHPSTDFDFVLRASAKSFEKFRYAYEGIVGDKQGWLADEIRDCVRARILELRPEWKDLKYGFNGPLLPFPDALG
jgi:hypothetical protein